MATNDAPRETRYASLIFRYREDILTQWCSLLELDTDDPAAPFIQDQLDASILALANWMLGEDPVGSTMSMQWVGIHPSRELTAGAVVSMSLLPQAVQSALQPERDLEHADLAARVAGFTGEMTTRILRAADVIPGDDRWEQIATEVETRYEAQRLQRVRRLDVMIEIANAVSTGEDLDTLLERVQDAATRLLGCDYTEISLLDPHAGRLHCHLVYSAGSRQRQLENTPVEQGLADEVLRRGEPFAVNDYRTACRERSIPLSSALDDEQQRAWMGAPLRQGDQVIGVVAVSSPMNSFEREDIELLGAIAGQTAVALENQRLLDTQARHVALLSAVNLLARQIAEVREPERLLDTAADLIHEYFNYGLVSIFQIASDREPLRIRSRAPVGIEGEDSNLEIPVGTDTVVGSVARACRPVRHDDIHAGVPHVTTRATAGTRSEMAAPIIHSGRLLGVLDVQSEEIGAFDDHDLTTLQTIADQIAVGLENSRLFADEAQRTRELSLMLRTTHAAGSSLLLDEVLERLAEGIAEAAGTTDCLIHLFDDEGGFFRPAVRVGEEVNVASAAFQSCDRLLPTDDFTGLTQVLTDPSPVLICPFQTDARIEPEEAAILLIPLRTRQRTLGMAVVPSRIDSYHRYPREQMSLIQGVADSAALAVENARLYARAHGLAIAEERGRLAQEIHDTLAQGLTAIALQLELADSYLPGQPDQASAVVRRALELSRQNLDEARRSVLDLRAADVHQMSLPDAISQLLRRLGESADATFEFANEGVSHRLPARVEVGLFRIIEEALENARRHADATLVRVRLRADSNTVSAVVEDNGQGFDPGTMASQDDGHAGYGLLGIRERARLLGGSLTVSTNPGTGSRLRVVVPYELPQPASRMSGIAQRELR